MNVKNLSVPMIELNRSVIRELLDQLHTVQDELETLMIPYIEQTESIPVEKKKTIGEWLRNCRESHHHYRSTLDQGFTDLASLFGELDHETL